MAEDRKVFSDSVTPLPAAGGSTHLGLMVARAMPETGKERMTVVFSLALPDSAQADLQKMVAEGKVLTPKELTKNYSADAGDAKALTSWLKSARSWKPSRPKRSSSGPCSWKRETSGGRSGEPTPRSAHSGDWIALRPSSGTELCWSRSTSPRPSRCSSW